MDKWNLSLMRKQLLNIVDYFLFYSQIFSYDNLCVIQCAVLSLNTSTSSGFNFFQTFHVVPYNYRISMLPLDYY